jgi:hypothetical protein
LGSSAHGLKTATQAVDGGAMDGAPICFQCGQAIETDPTRLNHLEDGRPCPTCSERLMESLRPLLPGWDEEPAAALEDGAPASFELVDPGPPDAEPA